MNETRGGAVLHTVFFIGEACKAARQFFVNVLSTFLGRRTYSPL